MLPITSPLLSSAETVKRDTGRLGALRNAAMGVYFSSSYRNFVESLISRFLPNLIIFSLFYGETVSPS